MDQSYDHKKLDKKWQARWEKEQIYHASDRSDKPKKYVLIEFPYPSGEGLHMGHLRPYLAGDIYSRAKRMQGFETMFPIGWDAFGLPAENFAIKKGVHPSVSTAKNIANAKQQLQSWGIGFDWQREVNTTDPNYYKWTQWIFLQFYKAGLAYEATGLINWCPKDKTGLANEEVVDGCCERCGTQVEKKELRQWYLKITAYAEKLLAGLQDLNWPAPIKLMQENWIGKSEGAEIEFPLAGEEAPSNVIIVHGCPSSPNNDPATRTYDKHWIPWLKSELEKRGVKAYAPLMPNPWNPVYADWKAEFEKLPVDENSVLIGHSCAAAFLAKWLGETKRPVKQLIFVAGARIPREGDHRKDDLYVGEISEDIKNLAKERIIFVSNDEERHVQAAQIYKQALDARLIELQNRGHFTGKTPGNHEFPELLNIVAPRIKVFTTRPDTIFGATYMVLAPEHPLVAQITTAEQKTYVSTYVSKSALESEQDRTNQEKEKTGVFTGAYAINPATKEKIPVWIADYVLGTYGTGAIMAVPAHDERDLEFAKKFKLPVKVVVDEANKLVDSGKYSGLDWEEAKKKITKDFGTAKVQYKLRDWVFSRQRYWGEPIPLIHCEKCGIVPVPDDQLPVKLPEVEKYEPTGTGESPLASIESWVNTKCPKCDGKAKRETNTMPQWAGSSWYWLRYTDPDNDKELADKKLLQYWTPVDVYFGGMEHTTLHLLYSRFWNLFLYDQGIVTAKEAYARRVPHGIILAADGEKMSKSRGNVVNPDDIVAEYGADVLRLFEPFLGPHEATLPWNDKGIVGIKRFLEKVWKHQQSFQDGPDNRNIHKLIKRITSDIDQFKFNTAIAAFMEFLNENKEMSRANWESFLILLSPFASHLAEELWSQLGHNDSIHRQVWPQYDEQLAKDEVVTVVVQVLGRVRASLEVAAGADQAEVKELALKDANVQKHLAGKAIAKEIFVKDKLINFVIK